MPYHEASASQNKWLLGHDLRLGHFADRYTFSVCICSRSNNKAYRCSILRPLPSQVSRLSEMCIQEKQFLLSQTEAVVEEIIQ